MSEFLKDVLGKPVVVHEKIGVERDKALGDLSKEKRKSQAAWALKQRRMTAGHTARAGGDYR